MEGNAEMRFTRDPAESPRGHAGNARGEFERRFREKPLNHCAARLQHAAENERDFCGVEVRELMWTAGERILALHCRMDIPGEGLRLGVEKCSELLEIT